MILSSFFDVFGQVLISRWGLIFFIVNTVIIFGVGQYLLLTYVKRATEGLRTKKGVKATYSLVVVVQYIVIGMLGLMILQMLFNSHYSTLLIIAVTIMSYVPACLYSVFTILQVLYVV